LKNIEDILARCIEDIKARRSTLEGCLARYPSMCSQLEPLLRIALSIKEPPSFKPTNDFKNRARVQLMDYIHDKRNVKKSWRDFHISGIRQSWCAGWLKAATIVIAIILVISALGTGTAYASKDSLPGDILYSVKIGTEQVRRFLTVNDITRIELELTLADTRVEEIGVLANKNPERITLAVKGYEKNLTTAIVRAANNRDRDISAEGLEMVALAALKHISIIDGIIDSVKVAEKESLRQAERIALRAQFRVLRALAGEDPVRAMEINIVAMQNRLNRANAAADKGDLIEAENTLEQFKEMYRFSEEISRIPKESGHDTTAIDALNAQAKSAHFEIIRNIYGKVSDEAIASVKQVMGIPVEENAKENIRQPEKDTDNNIPGQTDQHSKESGIVPDEPGNVPDEPGNTPEGPDNAPEEPSNNPDEPGNIPEEPGVPPEGPGELPESPGTGSPPGSSGSPPDGPPGNGSGGSGNGKS